MGLHVCVLVVAIVTVSCGPKATSVVHPRNRALLAEARDHASRDEVDEAERAYAAAYAQTKDFAILQERVEFLIRAGRATKAVEAAKAHVDRHVREKRAVSLYGEALLGAERGGDALENAELLRQLEGEAPGGYEQQGRALVLVNRPEEGLEALHKAVQLGGAVARYHRSLGLALHELGKDDEAALEFRAVVKAAPKDAEARALLAMALRGQLEYAEARATLEAALTLDPKSGRAYFELGLLHEVMKESDEAEQALSRAIELSPHEGLHWYGIAERHRLSKRTDDAVIAYKRALAIDPPYARAFEQLGLIFDSRGSYDEAEPLLLEAIKRRPRPISYARLGAIFARKQDAVKALEYYERFLELAEKSDPERPRAVSAEKKLKPARKR
jgi:superkiller protein 3